jgi:hypothetical protein
MLRHKHRKVGELVTMSAYGRKIKSNPCFLQGFPRSPDPFVGIIVKIDLRSIVDYPISVQWIAPPSQYENNPTIHSLRELKVYRKKKNVNTRNLQKD